MLANVFNASKSFALVVVDVYTKNGKPNGRIYATVNIFIECLVFVQTYNHWTDTHTHALSHSICSVWVAKRHIAGIFMIAKRELMLRMLESTTYQKHYTSFYRSQPIHYCMLYFTRKYKPFHDMFHFIHTQFDSVSLSVARSFINAHFGMLLNRHRTGANSTFYSTQSISST